MGYAVKEVFYTLQGEGMNAGRAAVFCRFAGCNLWSGRAEDRRRAACSFCDTDFVGTDGTGGGRFRTADDLADAIQATWRGPSAAHRFAVLTGGEPLLQVDGALIAALHARRFEIAVETNGTIEPPEGIDWICVSPKTLPLAADRGGRTQAGLPEPAPRAVRRRGARLPAPAPAADGRCRRCGQHRRRRGLLPRQPALAAHPPEPQARGDPLMHELSKQFRFDAAHTLHREIDAEPSRRVHGHSYRGRGGGKGQARPADGDDHRPGPL